MKIKFDFITNSSSSSFLVIFDKEITKIEDVQFTILGDRKAEQVFHDAIYQKPILVNSKDQKQIDDTATALSHGYIDEIKSYSDYQDDFCKREGITIPEMYKNRSWMQAFYAEYENIQYRLCLKKAIEFLSNNDGKYMYTFHYGDEDGEFMSQMEHGGTFNSVPHIKINKH